MKKNYRVVWGKSALRKLGQLYNIDHAKVYKNSKTFLSRNPYGQSYGSADYPDFQFNGTRTQAGRLRYFMVSMIRYRVVCADFLLCTEHNCKNGQLSEETIMQAKQV